MWGTCLSVKNRVVNTLRCVINTTIVLISLVMVFIIVFRRNHHTNVGNIVSNNTSAFLSGAGTGAISTGLTHVAGCFTVTFFMLTVVTGVVSFDRGWEMTPFIHCCGTFWGVCPYCCNKKERCGRSD